MKIEILIFCFLAVWAFLFPIAIIRAIKKFMQTKRIEYTEEERSSRLHNFKFFMMCTKFGGWWFLILGGLLLLSAIPPLLDQNSTTLVNGIPRKELWIKIFSFIFASIFPTIGATIVFTPKRNMEDYLLRFQGFSERYYKSQKIEKSQDGSTLDTRQK